jgi:hypothetical protein
MWKLSPAERLDYWKRFRKEIDSMSFESALEHVARFWSRAPFTPFYLEYDRPETWPDPWTLIAENYYCDLAKALAIVYTLHLSDHKNCDLEVRVYRQHGTLHQFNLVWINNGKYVLNLESSEVVNKKSIPESLVKIIEYSSADLGLDRY